MYMNLNCSLDYKRYIFYFFSFTHRCFIFILLFFVGYYRLSNYFLCNWKVISKVIPVMKKMIRSMIQYNMYNSMKKIIELNSSLWNKFIVDVSTFHGQFILNNKCQFQIVHKVFLFFFLSSRCKLSNETDYARVAPDGWNGKRMKGSRYSLSKCYCRRMSKAFARFR